MSAASWNLPHSRGTPGMPAAIGPSWPPPWPPLPPPLPFSRHTKGAGAVTSARGCDLSGGPRSPPLPLLVNQGHVCVAGGGRGTSLLCVWGGRGMCVLCMCGWAGACVWGGGACVLCGEQGTCAVGVAGCFMWREMVRSSRQCITGISQTGCPDLLSSCPLPLSAPSSTHLHSCHILIHSHASYNVKL